MSIEKGNLAICRCMEHYIFNPGTRANSGSAMWLSKARFIWYSAGGGGGGREFFFGQNRSKIIFFAGPSGRIIFFITKNYIYMFNMKAFATTYCLIHAFAITSYSTVLIFKAFATNSHSFQVFATTADCSRNIVNLTLFRFSSQIQTDRLIWQACVNITHLLSRTFIHNNLSF